MAVFRELKRAATSLARYPSLLGVAVLLAIFRPPPALQLLSRLFYWGAALLTFLVTPLFMAAMLKMSDNALREASSTAGLWDAVKGRYTSLLGANVLVSVARLGVIVVFGLVGAVVVALVIGTSVAMSDPTSAGAGVLAGAGMATIAAVLLLGLVGGLATLAVDVLFRFHKPAAVLGEQSATDALRQSWGLVRSHPKTALGYYVVQLFLGLAIGAVVVALLVGVAAANPLGGLSTSDLGATLLAVLAAGYVGRSLTYAITLPYTVNVYQYLRYQSDGA